MEEDLNAEVSFSVNHPISLPRTHSLTTLIVMEAHRHVLQWGQGNFSGDKDKILGVQGEESD